MVLDLSLSLITHHVLSSKPHPLPQSKARRPISALGSKPQSMRAGFSRSARVVRAVVPKSCGSQCPKQRVLWIFTKDEFVLAALSAVQGKHTSKDDDDDDDDGDDSDRGESGGMAI